MAKETHIKTDKNPLTAGVLGSYLRFSYRISERMPLGLLISVYLAYWISLIYFTVKIQNWIITQNSIGGFPKVLEGLLDFLILELCVGIFFVSIIGGIIVWWMTERRSDQNA